MKLISFEKRFYHRYLIVLILLFISILSLLNAEKNSEVTISQGKTGYPVFFNEREIFQIYAGNKHMSPEERALIIEKRLDKIRNNYKIIPDSLKLIKEQSDWVIMYSQIPLIYITDEDSLILKKGKYQIALEIKDKIQKEFIPLISSLTLKRRILNIIRIVLVIALILFVSYFLFKLISRIWKKTERWIDLISQKHPQGFILRGIKLVSAEQLEKSIILILKLFRFIINIFILYNVVYLILLSIPATNNIARQLQQYLMRPLVLAGKSFLDYLPNIFFILMVVLIARYCIRFLRYLFDEIHKGNITFKNFYPDWADSTFQICKFLIYFFVAVIIFPYLPGSDSPAFKGISIFVGVLFSLGSSSAIANMVAGIIITYMRAFKVGDIVKIGDTIGELRENSLLVIRIRTFKNVEITIPNSLVLSGQILDYSHYSQDRGLVVHSKVTIGYDVPWVKVHQLLMDAAKRTEGLLKDKEPFVLQTALNDFAVEYEINAYTCQPSILPRIYSDLHRHIQDTFKEANVEIMSPIYNAVRDGNELTIPKE